MNDPKITVAFLDVGQGDAIVAILPDETSAIVVDCFKSQVALDYLEEKGIDTLSYVFVTHSDKDHIDGIAALLQNFVDNFGPVNRIGYNLDTITAGRDKTRTLRQIAQLAVRKGIVTEEPPRTGHQYQLQDVTIDVLHPNTENFNLAATTDDTNNASIVLRITFAEKRILLTGDLAARGWKWIVERDTDLSADIFKFPHHGAWYETNETHSLDQILDQVNPSFVVISVGTQNRYEHPRSETLELLRSRPNLLFLCTQATKQCFPDLDESKPVCPCAGTIEVVVSAENTKIIPHNPPCRNQL